VGSEGKIRQNPRERFPNEVILEEWSSGTDSFFVNYFTIEDRASFKAYFFEKKHKQGGSLFSAFPRSFVHAELQLYVGLTRYWH